MVGSILSKLLSALKALLFFFHVAFRVYLLLLSRLSSFTQCDGDALLLRLAFMHECANVGRNSLIRFTLFKWHDFCPIQLG